MILIDAAFCHPSVQHIESLFALAAFNNLADTQNARTSIAATDLPCRSLAIEGLNFLWMIQNDLGALDVLLSGLEVHSPLHGEFESLLCPLKRLPVHGPGSSHNPIVVPCGGHH